MADYIEFSVWEKRLLAYIRDRAPREHRKLVRKAGNLLRKNVRRSTAKVEGDLRKSYRIKTKGDTTTVYTNKFYAKMVEEGHELVLVTDRIKKGGRRYRVKKSLGFVPGKFYFRKGFEQTEKELPGMLKDFLRQMGKELGMDVSG
jgi:hypothetical protein